MNLLLFNLAADDQHVTLSFGLRWIAELAPHFDHIDVVTMYEGRHSLPPNVTVWSVGRERGYGKAHRVVRFYAVVARVLRTRRIDVAFTHMIHSFAVLFAPVSRLKGIPNVLWYAHGAVPPALRVAHALVDRVASSTPEGFRIPSRKVAFIGQGIDTSLFTPGRGRDASVFHVVSVGRVSPVKGLDVLLEALHGWRAPDGRSWKLTIVGGGTSDEEVRHEQELKRRAEELDEGGRVRFAGRLDPVQIVPLLQEADVFVNLSATGSLDKAIVEAMATGCPVLSCNDAFRSIAEEHGLSTLWVDRSVESVRAGLERIARLDAAQAEALSGRVRGIALEEHSLDGFIRRLRGLLVAEAAGKVA